MARILQLTLIATLSCLLSHSSLTAAEKEGNIKLFNGKDLSGWDTYLRGDAKPEDVWSIKDGVIFCKGKPAGYIITKKEYSDYVLRLEWRWAKKGGRKNSGVFVHVSGPNKIWPKGAEAQLMANHAGDFWLVGGFKLKVDPARQDKRVSRHYFRMESAGKVEKPEGEWNQYEITCKGDEITLKINGKVVNKGTAAESTKGKILLQSEGAEIHFRNITLSPLK